MADEKEILQRLQRVYDRCHLMTHGELINELDSIIETYHLGSYASQLNTYKDDYNRMMHYMLEGFDDNMRSRIYQQNQHGLINLLREIMHQTKVVLIPSLTKAYESRKSIDFSQAEQRLLTLSQDVAIAQLSGEEAMASAYLAQNSYRVNLFNAVLSAGPLGQNESYCLQNILLNETLEVTDILLILSAMMLAQQFCFDPERFRLLLLALGHSSNDDIRQRALVSIAFSLPSETEMKLYPELRIDFLGVLKSANLINTFSNLQTQVLYSVTATDDMKKMNRDIMPSIIDEVKRQNMMNPDATSLEEILHPDNEEKSMEKLEEKLDKMRKMQEKGSDLLFGGFSAMKRYSFFYTLMNWFCPYSANHPDVAHITTDPVMKNLFQSLEQATQLCDSDKYSMAFGLNHVFNSLPPQLKQMLQSGEAKIGVLDEELVNDENYRRRMYLQSLYRFYNLYSSKNDFRNPFADRSSWCFLLHPYLKESAEEANLLAGLAHRLLQKNNANDAFLVLQADKAHEGTLDNLILLGTCYYRQNKSVEAVRCYQEALFLDPDNDRLRQRLGNIAIESRMWTQAEQTFREIRQHHSDAYTTDVQLHLAEALMHLNKVDEAREIILPFDFAEEQTVEMRRLLGWYYLLAGKADKALIFYSQIPDADMLAEDYFRLTFVHLCLHDNHSATVTLRSVIERKDGKMVIAENIPEKDCPTATNINYLALAGIAQEEWSILIDIAQM